MSTKIAINKEVAVTALYFRNNQDFQTFPKRMEFEGSTYTFLESGFQYLITQGQKIVRIFDMTDGRNSFRLRCEDDQASWTLVNMTLVS